MNCINLVRAMMEEDVVANEEYNAVAPSMAAGGISSVDVMNPDAVYVAKMKELHGIYSKGAVRPVQVERGEKGYRLQMGRHEP